MDTAIQVRRPLDKGLMVGQKRPLLPRQVWSIRVRLEMSGSPRDGGGEDLVGGVEAAPPHQLPQVFAAHRVFTDKQGLGRG